MGDASQPRWSYLREERPSPFVAVIRLHRPERKNALNLAMREEISAAVAEAEGDESTRVIVLAGGAEFFASGGDIVENSKIDAIGNLARSRKKGAYWRVLAECSKPLIAAVRGYALGGAAELMMLADIIVASKTARLGQPEPRLGIIPGSGGTQRLPRAVGKYAAMHILLGGKLITGEHAARIGLVSEAVDDEAVERRAFELAETIAMNQPYAVRAAKCAVLAADELSLKGGLFLESSLLGAVIGSRDFRAAKKENMKIEKTVYRDI